MGRRNKRVVPFELTLKDDEVIVAYKKGSGGVILRTYNSVKEVVTLEQRFNNHFVESYVRRHLYGQRSHGIGCSGTKVLHLQASVVFRIKKIADIKEALEKNG